MGGMTDWPASPAARLRVIDLETTGDSFANGGVVEVGWQDLAPDRTGSWALHGDPGRAGQSGLPDLRRDLGRAPYRGRGRGGAPVWTDAAPASCKAMACVALAAHRAAFEQRWCLPQLTGRARWICTYKCALRLWPDAPSHSNQGLRYWRRPGGPGPRNRAARAPGRAGRLRHGPPPARHAGLASVAQLLAWSEQPALLVRVPTGALRGRRWEELDDAQLDQVLGRGMRARTGTCCSPRGRSEPGAAGAPRPQRTRCGCSSTRAGNGYFFSRYPVLKIQAIAARHAAMNTSVIPRLTPRPMSDVPKKLQRKPLTR